MRFRQILPILLISAMAASHAQDVPSAVQAAIKRADQAIERIVNIPETQRTFDNTLGALDEIDARLNKEVSLTIFMANVAVDAKTRSEARAADEAVSNWYAALGKREDLYKAVKQFADTKPVLQGEQKRFLEFTMRDYRLSGMDLPKVKRDRLLAIELELNKLGIEFDQNIADDDTKVPFLPEELAGVPKDVLDRQILSNGVYLFGLDDPSYDGIGSHCTNDKTRHKAWLAYKRRAGQRNVDVLEKMIRLRAEHAELLGFKNHVDEVLATRMAKNAETVAKFYKDLRPIVRKKALLDMQEFTAEKRKFTGDKNAKLFPWDYAFYKNRLSEKKYAVDNLKVAEYFPMQAVVDGLFSITKSLYGLEYKDVTAKAGEIAMAPWHPDVKLYQVSDKATGKVLGHIYLDLFPRQGKYTHAACWGLVPRKIFPDGTVQLPLCALVCNFTKPTATKPSLLPHDEVETLFHEFGHGLHNLLTEATMARFAGTAVERDFVEAPSQMFENWTWDSKVLSTFARHYKTGKPIPASMLKGMLAARNLGSGIEAEHQFYYGMADQAFHTVANGEVNTTKVATELYPQVELYPKIVGPMFQASFGHLNGYDGAYYGYQWSLVYAQDMYQRFEQLGVLNPKAGAYYRSKILANGGTKDASAMLRDYLGREPKMDAFLRHLGIGK